MKKCKIKKKKIKIKFCFLLDILGLQKEDGSFSGDKWGEIDTRFSYCALSCLSLLGISDQQVSDKAIEFVLKCQNFDGGFGVTPKAESHAGQSKKKKKKILIKNKKKSFLLCWSISNYKFIR